jgi:hypothetical protein
MSRPVIPFTDICDGAAQAGLRDGRDHRQRRPAPRDVGELAAAGDAALDIVRTLSKSTAGVLLSRGLTLEPGDIIATGTPSGVGYAMEPPHFLASGDKVSASVEGIGSLENTIA